MAKDHFKRCGLGQVDHWRLPGFWQGRPRRPVSTGAAAVLTSHPESSSPFKLIQKHVVAATAECHGQTEVSFKTEINSHHL